MIRTKRLTLKPFAECDTDSALDLLTNDIIKKTYMLPDFEKHEDALPLFKRLTELSQDENHYVRGIYLNKHLIGFLNDVEIENGSIELGYLIRPDYHGRGYMTEALCGVISDLFDQGYCEVITGAFEDNIASIRVMIKAGMTKLDKLDEIEYRGTIHRCVYYSKKKQE
ncbi:MAG: GNAT family N-acetyltransferase [Oscillospiraceae bacterium]|nr:GNAT family N-acetyltransferase [Oscillospiraceae bacterium]